MDFKRLVVIIDWQGMDTRTVVMVMDTAMDTPMTILMDTRTWMVDITILMIQVCVCQAYIIADEL